MAAASESARRVQLGDEIVILTSDQQRYVGFAVRGKDGVRVWGRSVSLLELVGREYGQVFDFDTDGSLTATDRPLVPKLSVEDVSSHAGDNRNLKKVADGVADRRIAAESLRQTAGSTEELVESIAKTSDTFSHKTELSQQKYIRTKKARILRRLQLLPASPADVAHSNRHRAETGRPGVVAVRADTLGLMMCLANVCAGSTALVVDDSGGAVAYAVWRRLAGTGRLILPYTSKHWLPLLDPAPPSGPADSHAPGRQLQWRQHPRIAAVPWTYLSAEAAPDGSLVLAAADGSARLHSSRPPKRPRVAQARASPDNGTGTEDGGDEEEEEDEDGADDAAATPGPDDTASAAPPPEPSTDPASAASHGPAGAAAEPPAASEPPTAAELHSWLAGGADAAVVASACHPLQAALACARLTRPGGSIAVFAVSPGPLAELASALRAEGICRDVRVQSLFARDFQVLPRATHPAMNMHAASGYVLSGQVVVHPYLAARPQAADLGRSGVPAPKPVPSTAPVAVSVAPPS